MEHIGVITSAGSHNDRHVNRRPMYSVCVCSGRSVEGEGEKESERASERDLKTIRADM